MREIQMVDLKSQYWKIKPQVDKLVIELIEEGAYINGPAVKQFQQNLAQFLGCKHVIGCGNGTDALQIALMALCLQPGDEVITTPFTFVATVEVIILLGLKVVFVDADQDTFNIDTTKIEAAITPRTKCIIPVHLFGQPANMQQVMDIARKHHLYVVEDNAQAIGAECLIDGVMKKTGTIGDIGCLSFYPSKNLSCFGDGGAIITNHDALFTRMKQITNHGSDVKYYHNSVGVNSRLDNLQAGILNLKLQHLLEYTSARQKAADSYYQALANIPDITLPKKSVHTTHVFHQYTVKVERRDELADFLKAKSIPTMVYYPVPLHLQGAYQNEKYPKGSFPVAENLSQQVLSLPMHTELEVEQLNYIAQNIINFYNQL